ncbi:MAG: hypothetical protein CL838_07430 [Crocinitomicaceae bacterium]|nr:hypothetical protein [Crocinitomicaceae bacterium]
MAIKKRSSSYNPNFMFWLIWFLIHITLCVLVNLFCLKYIISPKLMIFTKVFFVLSKILSFLIDPFFWIIIFLALGLFGRIKYRRRKYLLTAIIFILFFSNGLVYRTIFNKWKINHNIKNEKFEYGILMGGIISLSSTKENIQFNKRNDRLLNTIELYHKKTISKIIITGASGSLSSDMKEAEILKSYLESIDIKAKDILTETKSKNTYENAVFTTELINNERRKKTCLLITSDYHMRRSMACFNQTGLNVTPFCKEAEKTHFDLETILIPQSNILFKWKVLFHEIIGYYTYKVMGYI